MAHEALVHLVRAAPALVVDLFRRSLQLGEPLHVVSRVTAAEVVDLHLAEYRADVVLLLGDPERPSEAFVIEVQGEARMLLQLLRRWGFELSDRRVREVEACDDPGQLERWATRVLDARSLADVFGDEP